MRYERLLFPTALLLAACVQDANPSNETEADAAGLDGGDSTADAAAPDGALADGPLGDGAAVQPDSATPVPDAAAPAPDAALSDGQAPRPCDDVDCDACFVCVDGTCVPDDARLAEDAPTCGTMCMDWPNACTAIVVTHAPLRPGPCYDADEEALCEWTRGAWTLGACAPLECGDGDLGCVDECAFACDCGPWSRWDPALGCVGRPDCHPGGCDAEAVCAGAWLTGDICVDPAGRPLDAACCAAIECGPVGSHRRAEDGACVVTRPGCGVPHDAPPCEAGDPPCDLGLFLLETTRLGARGGVCYGPGSARPQASPTLRPLVRNYAEEPVEITYTSRCPDGPASMTGLPEPFDYYVTCNDGICEQTGMPQTVRVDREWLGPLARFDPAGDECNDALAPGIYTLRATLPLTSNHTVCNFSALELRIVAAAEAEE